MYIHLQGQPMNTQQKQNSRPKISKKIILTIILFLSPILYIPAIASKYSSPNPTDIKGIYQPEVSKDAHVHDGAVSEENEELNPRTPNGLVRLSSTEAFESPAYYYTDQCRLEETIQLMRSNGILSDRQDEYYIKNLNNETLTTAQLGRKHLFDEIIGNQNNELKAGKYMILLQSYDPHVTVTGNGEIQLNKSAQDNEMYGLQLIRSNGSVVSKTSPIQDLPTEYNSMVELVEESFVITESDIEQTHYIQAYNADVWQDHELGSNGRPNYSYNTSIRTTCFALIPVPEPLDLHATIPDVLEPEALEVVGELPIFIDPEAGIIISQAQLQCTAQKTNELISFLRRSPIEILWVHEYWLTHSVITPCFGENLAKDYEYIFQSVSADNVILWRSLYLNDNQLDEQEVQSIMITLSQEHDISISVQDNW